MVYRLLALFFLVFVLTGVNYCREDFEIGAQSSSPTPSPSPSPSPTPVDDDDDDEIVPTPTPTATPTPTPVPTPDPLGDPPTLSLLRSLEDLSQPTQSGVTEPSVSDSEELLNNWLGQIGIESEADVRTSLVSMALDRDGDGFVDCLELQVGSDPFSPHSAPIQLLEMFDFDPDFDGLPVHMELSLKLNPFHFDTDGDGYSDLVEILAGSDPLDARSTPELGDLSELCSSEIDYTSTLLLSHSVRAGDSLTKILARLTRLWELEHQKSGIPVADRQRGFLSDLSRSEEPGG